MTDDIENQFERDLLDLIFINRENLPDEELHTARIMVGPAYWDDMEKGNRINGGEIILELSKRPDTPFEFVKKNGGNHNLYRFTDRADSNLDID